MPVRRPVAIAIAAVAGALTLAGCHDPAKSSLPAPKAAFCAAAQRYDEEVQKPSKATQQERAASQVQYVERMAAAAPADIKRAAGVFLDALRRRAAGDTSVVDDPAVKRAVDDVNRRAGNGCGFYQNNEGGGGGI